MIYSLPITDREMRGLERLPFLLRGSTARRSRLQQYGLTPCLYARGGTEHAERVVYDRVRAPYHCAEPQERVHTRHVCTSPMPARDCICGFLANGKTSDYHTSFNALLTGMLELHNIGAVPH